MVPSHRERTHVTSQGGEEGVGFAGLGRTCVIVVFPVLPVALVYGSAKQMAKSVLPGALATEGGWERAEDLRPPCGGLGLLSGASEAPEAVRFAGQAG